MKVEFLPYQKKVGMKFINRPENDPEQRMLTIWWDLCNKLPEGSRVYLKPTAAERMDRDKMGMPPKPVTGLCLVPVIVDESGKEAPYFPQEGETVHPLQFVRTKKVGVSTGRKTRIMQQKDGRYVEE